MLPRNSSILCLIVALLPGALAAQVTPVPQIAVIENGTLNEPLEEVNISARGARYAAPTQRDQIGRIWAPVMINGKGPFRLVLDTGATGSGIVAGVVSVLGLDPAAAKPMRLRGVTGHAVVQAVKADNLSIGDVWLSPVNMPILPDALGGAEGILGSAGLTEMRVFVSFRYDRIEITRSRGERASRDMMVLPFEATRFSPLMVDATIGGVKVKAVINTGGQATVGNLALKRAIAGGRRARRSLEKDLITGVTLETEEAEASKASIQMGDILIRDAHITFGDMPLFKHWGYDNTPVVLIGMDALGLLDTLIIDYKMKELQLRLRRG